MKKQHVLLASFAITTALVTPVSHADTFHEALVGGKAYGNFNLRFEDVSQDNARRDASAFTLRTRLGYTSGTINGWSFNVEVEDSRIVLGQGDYSVDPAGYNSGIYSIIADPETTELDQGYVQYKNEDVTVKLGRQVITLDGHRFVGHVGWRQDRQTFDAATVVYHPNDKLTTTYSYLKQRNRIFGEAQDIDAKDHLFNASYKTSLGKLVGYAYLLEADTQDTNGLDTYGLSFNGKTGNDNLTWIYHAEYATQSSKSAVNDFDATYLSAKLSAKIKSYTVGLGYELLGSDDGLFGFSTPLATLHKFNGWADIFLATPNEGLEDVNVSFATKALGGNWLLAYHDYSADDASATVDDLGSEFNAQYTTKIKEHYTLGLKYANYSGDSGRTDTDKIWVWVSTGF